MNSKNHRQNHNFQIIYFLIGSCHTSDGAYALLCDLREERQSAIDNYRVQQIKDEAKEIRIKRKSDDKAEQKEKEAELLELENNRKMGKILYQSALDEINFIDKCIAYMQPLRKFKNLSDNEAHEAAQFDEWKYELIERAENYLLTMGTIPADQFAAMRQHPSFITDILPRIKQVQQLMISKEGLRELTEDKKIKQFILPEKIK